MENMILTLKNKIIDYVYVVSKQPVLYKDLLLANCLYNEGMNVDSGKLNFRMRLNRAYIAYGLLCFCVLTPLTLLTHAILTKLDFHLSIIGSIVATSCVCMGFGVFKQWIRKELTLRLIKQAWLVHFPYFPYEKYSQKIEIIYQKSVKEEILKKDLEKYVLDNILKDK